MVRDHLPQYMRELNHNYTTWNAHYDPQNRFCMSKSIAEYDFVGNLSAPPSDVHHQVESMFRDVAEVPPERGDFWAYLNDLFPTSAPSGHCGNTTSKMHLFYEKRDVYNA